MAKGSRGRRDGGSRARSSSSRASRPQTKRHFPRTARLNTLLQEIVAGFMERLDDDRIGFLTITGVEVDNDLNRAEVFISTFEQMESAEAEEELLEALTEYRKPVQAAIARQAQIRKTPEVVFSFDPAVRAGARIEEILSSLGPISAETEIESETAAESESETDDADNAVVEDSARSED